MLLPGIVNKSTSDRYKESVAIMNYLLSLAMMIAAGVMIFIFSRKVFSKSNEFLSIKEDDASIIRISFFFLCAGIFWLVCSFIYFSWFGDDHHMIFSALMSRDRRGDRLPGAPLARFALRKMSPTQISRLPDSHLLALIASQEFYSDDFIKVIVGAQPARATPAGGPETLTDHPECTTLTVVDFLTGWNAKYRAAASKLVLPPLWPRAMNELLYSPHPEARLAVTRCLNMPRQELLRFSISDSFPEVRKSACRRICKSITADEAMSLLRSTYPEIRSAAINSRLLPRNQVVTLCKSDSHESVRRVAWDNLLPLLTTEEAIGLSTSYYNDVTSAVIDSDMLPRDMVLKFCTNNNEADLRKVAWARLELDLTSDEALTLSRSKFEDVRLYAITSGKLPRPYLIKMCVIDASPHNRKIVWHLVEEGLTKSEATLIMKSPDVAVRLLAVQSGLLERSTLIDCCLRDNSPRVYRVAWQKIRDHLTVSDAISLSDSNHEEVRIDVVQSDVLPRSYLISCCRYDTARTVRAAAYQRARPKLTIDEALFLSRSNYDEICEWAIDSGLLPLSRRIWLAIRSLFK